VVAMKIAIKGPSNSGQYWFRIVADNGATLASSEQYVAKQSAIHAAGLVKTGAGSAPIYDETN
jgi:uncharacterized protein YegP (UPF0339 family)